MMSSDFESATVDRSARYARSRYWQYWLLWLVIGTLIGGGSVWLINRGSSEATAPETLAQGPPPRPVEISRLTTGEGIQSIELIGQVEARTSATVRSQTTGVVQQILVEPGDTISVGATMAVLDDSDQRLALSQAQANLASERSNLAELEVGTRPEIIEQRRALLQSAQAREAEALDNLQRTQELVTVGGLPQRSLIEARTAVADAQSSRLEAAAVLAEATAGPTTEEIAAQRATVTASQAAVDQTQLELSRTQIQATTAGTVEERMANIGDYLEVGDPILSMINRSDLDIFLEIPEDLAGQITPGLTVELTSRALPEWQGQAAIAGIIPIADEASRRQRVRLQLADPPPGLLPGMAIQGTLELASNASGFILSRDALVQRAEEWIVFAITDDQAQAIEVEIVADMGTSVAITSDQLEDGQSIVMRGSEGLQDGAVVNVTDDRPVGEEGG
ncbi:rnd family efflux transporter mfp subunit [Leptolyngbya sp. Heron Island J]|uniref:efflux RND transporter periplasmic adaptor subunit n=1 Tax=Leptolyngbya sp. Heron Island J TaxID=1385935 RepID=UPI0003B9A948|nr:efflux RND transporter periplasmic adaptor subunit [Leptolyngbya sp. Heron Island J]ESA38346.1 rnd family efflux transporter mfp subunit [Leptolyngbya sp. Heron Island J]